MKVADVVASEFSSWYPHLKHLTFESIVIDLDDKFVEYLLSDGIILPKCCQDESAYPSNGSDWSDQDDDEQEGVVQADFPQLHLAVKEAITRLGGAVFVKLNWSSPKDANWMLPQGLKCSSLSDIILILKSSDFVTHDLTAPFEHCTDFSLNASPTVKYQLILRRWKDINPLHEFRCFVRQSTLIGISQRDCTSHISEMEESRESIVTDVTDFYNGFLRGKLTHKSFVFDVWRPAPRDIRLVDLNPFGSQTDSLLFDWNQLNDMNQFLANDELDFRFVDTNKGIQPSTYGIYKLPIEALIGDDNHDSNSGCSG